MLSLKPVKTHNLKSTMQAQTMKKVNIKAKIQIQTTTLIKMMTMKMNLKTMTMNKFQKKHQTGVKSGNSTKANKQLRSRPAGYKLMKG